MIRTVFSVLTPAQRRAFLLLIPLMVLGTVIETVSIGMLLPVSAALLDPGSAASPKFSVFLGWGLGSRSVFVLFFLAYVVKSVAVLTLNVVQNRFVYGVMVDLSSRLFERYLEKDFAFHLRTSTSEVMKNVVNEVSMVVGGFLVPLLSTLTESLVLLGLSALLLYIEPVGTVITVVILGTVGAVYSRVTRRAFLELGARRSHHDRFRFQIVKESLASIREIKLDQKEAHFAGRYAYHNAIAGDSLRQQTTLQQVPRVFLELLVVGLFCAVVLYFQAKDLPARDYLPTLTVLAVGALRIMPSATKILTSIQQMRSSQASLPNVAFILGQSGRETPQPRPAMQDGPIRSIRFDGVAACYDGADEPVLQDISFEARADDTIAVFGGSGAGKSTFVGLLLGLLQPSSGGIAYDDVPIELARERMSREIGFVPQSVTLHHDTYAANIAFGVGPDEIDLGRVRSAAREARVDFLDAGALGSEIIVEDALNLSGGQAQRIGLARAYYKNPSVLVLDEITSALDNETEQRVLDNLALLRAGKICFIITHKSSALRLCNRFFLFEDGRCAEVSRDRASAFFERVAA